MLQAVQAIHNWSLLYPGAYFGSVLVLLLLVCAGWYRLGVTRLAVAGAPARRHVSVGWRTRPFVHTLAVQVAGVTLMGRLESDVDYLAASVAVRVSYR